MNKQKWTKASIPGTWFRLVSIGMAAVLLIGALLSAQPAQLASAAVEAVTCTSTTSGSWNSAIWSCPGGPTSADDVIILHEVSLAYNQSVKSLTIAADEAKSLLGILRFDKAVTLTLTGNLDIAPKGLLDPGTGTIAFGAGNQNIQTHGITVDFWNLSKMSTAGDTLAFDPANNSYVHVRNQLTLAGTADTKLKVRSTANGTIWQIYPDGNVNVQFVDVQDSKNVSKDIPDIAVALGVDSGNNNGWSFNGSAVLVTVNPNPAGYKKPVTITAYVQPASATGEVMFFYGDKVIDECEDVPLTGGIATCTTKDLPLGKQTISAVYTPAEGSNLPLNVATPVEQMIGFASIYIPMISQ